MFAALVVRSVGAVAERSFNMAKYGKYNKYGIDAFGNADPMRVMVHNVVGMMPSSSYSRPMADKLYTLMKKDYGENTKNENVVGKGGGRSPIKDVDFGMDGKPEYTKPIKKFDKGKAIKDLIGDPRDPFRAKIGKGEISKVSVVPTMKDGGVVRGAGKALRGRGRGKMV